MIELPSEEEIKNLSRLQTISDKSTTGEKRRNIHPFLFSPARLFLPTRIGLGRFGYIDKGTN